MLQSNVGRHQQWTHKLRWLAWPLHLLATVGGMTNERLVHQFTSCLCAFCSCSVLTSVLVCSLLRLWADLVNKSDWKSLMFPIFLCHITPCVSTKSTCLKAGFLVCQMPGQVDSAGSKESLTHCICFNCKLRILTIVWSWISWCAESRVRDP